tara:strand:+ start:589 stop:978 length:390 start_codon:yes stop_codon:yes gene_type:complete
MLFHKWCQYLKTRDISKFLDLYSQRCYVISSINKNFHSDNVTFPICKEPFQKNRVGVFKNFENILFSPYREFDINGFQSKFDKKTGILSGECKMEYKNNIYDSSHNMFLIKEDNYFKIMLHNIEMEKLK